MVGDCSLPFAASICLYWFRRCAMFCDVCHGPNLALHVSLLPAAKQAIVAFKTANISVICHQCTNTICVAEVPQMFKTRTYAIYATSGHGDHRYQQQEEKKRKDGHYWGETRSHFTLLCESKVVVVAGDGKDRRTQDFYVAAIELLLGNPTITGGKLYAYRSDPTKV